MNSVIPPRYRRRDTSQIKKIGVLTGGGDCPGLNAVIRAVVIAASEGRGYRVLGIEDAFMGLIDTEYEEPWGNRWLTAQDVHGIHRRGGTILGTSNKCDPFRFAIERDGKVVEEDVSERVLANFKQLELDALVVIGGDGSMAIAQQFIELGMPIVGVPKTIDNDLAATDVTFGFDTAVQVATDAIDRIQDTAESHDRTMLVEVMGRNAGWIALHAGMAAGAHAVLIPEIPYSIEPIVEMIDQRRASGRPYTVIVVAEGAHPTDEEAKLLTATPGGMPRHAGAAMHLAARLDGRIRSEVRVTVLGHTQRGGTPSQFDRVLATRFGEAAVRFIAERKFGHLTARRSGDIVPVLIRDAVRAQKRVDPMSQIVECARTLGIALGEPG